MTGRTHYIMPHNAILATCNAQVDPIMEITLHMCQLPRNLNLQMINRKTQDQNESTCCKNMNYNTKILTQSVIYKSSCLHLNNTRWLYSNILLLLLKSKCKQCILPPVLHIAGLVVCCYMCRIRHSCSIVSFHAVSPPPCCCSSICYR